MMMSLAYSSMLFKRASTLTHNDCLEEFTESNS